jgi:hypothetical protein
MDEAVPAHSRVARLKGEWIMMTRTAWLMVAAAVFSAGCASTSSWRSPQEEWRRGDWQLRQPQQEISARRMQQDLQRNVQRNFR